MAWQNLNPGAWVKTTQVRVRISVPGASFGLRKQRLASGDGLRMCEVMQTIIKLKEPHKKYLELNVLDMTMLHKWSWERCTLKQSQALECWVQGIKKSLAFRSNSLRTQDTKETLGDPLENFALNITLTSENGYLGPSAMIYVELGLTALGLESVAVEQQKVCTSLQKNHDAQRSDWPILRGFFRISLTVLSFLAQVWKPGSLGRLFGFKKRAWDLKSCERSAVIITDNC